MREHNQGFKQDEHLAYEAYQKAAALGHEQALQILKSKAASDPYAEYLIGQLFENGINGKKNRKQAVARYESACAKQQPEATMRLMLI